MFLGKNAIIISPGHGHADLVPSLLYDQAVNMLWLLWLERPCLTPSEDNISLPAWAWILAIQAYSSRHRDVMRIRTIGRVNV